MARLEAELPVISICDETSQRGRRSAGQCSHLHNGKKSWTRVQVFYFSRGRQYEIRCDFGKVDKHFVKTEHKSLVSMFSPKEPKARRDSQIVCKKPLWISQTLWFCDFVISQSQKLQLKSNLTLEAAIQMAHQSEIIESQVMDQNSLALKDLVEIQSKKKPVNSRRKERTCGPELSLRAITHSICYGWVHFIGPWCYSLRVLRSEQCLSQFLMTLLWQMRSPSPKVRTLPKVTLQRYVNLSLWVRWEMIVVVFQKVAVWIISS